MVGAPGHGKASIRWPAEAVWLSRRPHRRDRGQAEFKHPPAAHTYKLLLQSVKLFLCVQISPSRDNRGILQERRSDEPSSTTLMRWSGHQ